MQLQQLSKLLLDSGVFSGNKEKRIEIASRILSSGIEFSDESVQCLLREAKVRGARSPVGMIATWLENDAWIEIVAAQTEKAEAFDDVRKNGADMMFVSATNPFGWARSKVHVFQDHDHAGNLRLPDGQSEGPQGWNAYRVCYNLTDDEMREAGARDHRRRGCSRPEVVGEYGNKAVPKITYDPEEVRRARQFSRGTQPVAGPTPPAPPERRLYGE